MSKIQIVAAIGPNGEFGRGAHLPWERIPTDMKHFREATADGTTIMGRKTWESLPRKYRPLPGRAAVVVSRSLSHGALGPKGELGPILARNVREAITASLALRRNGPVSIIGGVSIIEEALQLREVGAIIVTHVDLDKMKGDADVFCKCLMHDRLLLYRWRLQRVYGHDDGGGVTFTHWVR